MAGKELKLRTSFNIAFAAKCYIPLLSCRYTCNIIFVQLTTSYTQREQAAYAKAGSIAEEVFSCIRTVITFCGWRREKAR